MSPKDEQLELFDTQDSLKDMTHERDHWRDRAVIAERKLEQVAKALRGLTT